MLKSSVNNFIIRFNSSMSSSSINIPNEIKIPKKIYRNDLTVLKILSSCVKNERGLPEFCTIDDPFTLPKDYLMRKKFFMSKASGKLSAKMAFQEMKHEFIKVAQDIPPVKNLMPLIDPEDVNKSVLAGQISNETGLNQLVRLLSPTSAWNFFESHKKECFSADVTLSLLQLLCATAGVEHNFDSPSEELYFSDKSPIEWRLDSPPELLFDAMGSAKCVESYGAMIRGAAKHNNPARAIELLREMIVKYPNDYLDVSSANALIRSLRYSELDDNAVLDFIVEVFEGMSRHNVTPSAHTFNNAIFAFAKRMPIDFVESLYQEMRALNIEPTLGTYSVILQCTFDRPFLLELVKDVVTILEERRRIVDYEETTSFDDRTLFTSAMVLLRRLNKANFALRLNEVVDGGGRFHMFTNEFSRGRYFDNFTKLLLHSRMDLAEVLLLVARYVPKCYVLQPATVNDLIERVAASGQTGLLLHIVELVNWNNARNIDTDSFPRILTLLLAADLSQASLAATVRDSLAKIFESTKMRESSVLAVATNFDLVVAIAIKLGDWGLLWGLLEYGRKRGCVRPSVVAPVVVDCFNGRDFDKVAFLWQCLTDSVPVQLMVEQRERDALRAAVDVTESQILPTLVKFSINVEELRASVDKCNTMLRRHADGSSSDEDTSSSDSE